MQLYMSFVAATPEDQGYARTHTVHTVTGDIHYKLA